jgi:hypothetical protein
MTKSGLIRKADKLFSALIREEDHCEWCGAKNDTLQCAHIFTRSYKITRYDPLNAICLCAGCHFRWHKEPVEAVEWVKNYLGVNVYEELRYTAKNRVDKIDLNQIISDLKNREGVYTK